MNSDPGRSLGRWLGAILLICTLAVYWRVSGFDFVDFDDQEYVKDNPHVQGGITWENVRWAFTRAYACNWHPVTWLSHMLDCQLFGRHAGAHHLVNVALHAANALILFALLRQLTRATWRSAMVAALFALHPAHVESVAWISERKDMLSTLFALLALLVYARKAASTATWRLKDYWLALLFYACSLLSKGMYVTLPFVLLLLDWWPLRRISLEVPATERKGLIKQLVWEKWPWLALSLLVSVVTYFVQKTGGAVISVEQISFPARVANALVAYVRYVSHMFWPADLTAIYPLPRAWAGWQVAAAGLTLAAVSFLAFRGARKLPFLAVGWAWFLGTLVPVIGLVQVGSQAMADRYTYFPFVGPFVAVVWAGADFFSRGQRLRRAGVCLIALALVACTIITSRQIEYWASSRALFERAVAVTRDNAQAQYNLGSVFEAEHRLADAATHYAEAVRIEPGNPDFRTSLGVVLARSGSTNAAREQLNIAMNTYLDIVSIRPNYAAGFNSIGIALSALGEHRDAVDAYARAVSVKPEYHVFRNNLGVALARTGDLRGAIAAHREAARSNPDYASAWCNLGAELVSAGQLDEAIPYLERAVRLDPTYAEAQSNLGGALARKGDHAAAIGHYTAALQLDPTLGRTHLNLGISLQKRGQQNEAIHHFSEAVRLEPGNLDARYNLGRGLWLEGKFPAAILQLETLLQSMPENAPAHFYLGQACAGLHRSQSAIAHLREALRLRPDWSDALGALAWILATDADAKYRNGPEAIVLVERISAVADSHQPTLLDVLAAAYAETGRFENAIVTGQQAAEMARRLGQTDLAAKVEKRISLYQTHQPFHETILPE